MFIYLDTIGKVDVRLEFQTEAADEIGLAVIAISLSIAAIFSPVSFMGGIAGQYFRQFGLTVAIAVMFSLLVARFVTPVIAAYFLRAPHDEIQHPNLIREMELTSKEFNRKFKNSPIKRTKHRGYLRNVAIALGNSKDAASMPALKKVWNHPEPVVREHANWALKQIETDHS